MATVRQPVAIIGAGIVGVAAAHWLERAGREILLIDRNPPGQGASHGNAGVLAASSVTPVTGPGLPLRAPRLALDSDFPLFVIWRRLPAIAPWLIRYLSHSSEAETRRIARALTPLVSDSLLQHRALACGTPAEKWLSDSEYMFAYESQRSLEADAFVWKLRGEAGFVPTIVEADQLKDRLPQAGPRIKLLAILKDHGFVASPGAYVRDLASCLRGPVIAAQVTDLDLSGGRIRAVETSQGRYECSEAIIAAGAWSRPLLRRLGIKVPLETERGYHVLLRNPSIQLPCPVMIASGKFVVTPMADGLRCAGAVEFGGLEPGASQAPLDFIRRQARTAFPQLTWDGEDEWLGHRPAPSDSIPLIGEIGSSGVHAAFGHHHVGLTSGPKTGRILAAMMTGGNFRIDTRPYSPNRFQVKSLFNYKGRK